MALKHRLTGSLHGMADFSLNTYHGLEQLALIATNPAILSRWDEVRATQDRRSAFLDNAIYNAFDVDGANTDYQTYRHRTGMAMEVGSLAIGGVALAKGAMKLGIKGVNAYRGFRAARTSLSPKLLSNYSTKGIQLNRFHQAARNLSLEGKNNIRILRGWAKSKGWEKFPNSNGGPEKWGVFKNGEFQWNLKIKPISSYRGGLHRGSGMPRFDARLDEGIYINPFTSEIGSSNIGTHLLLEQNYL